MSEQDTAKCERCGNRLESDAERLCKTCRAEAGKVDAEGVIYDFAPEAAPVAAARRIEPALVPAPSPVKLEYRAKSGSTESSDPQTIKNLYMPLWLLGGGVVIQVVATSISSRRRIEDALLTVGVEMVLGTAVMLGGILLAARIRQIDLGKFWTTVFKLSAISVAPGAVVALARPVLHLLPLGGILGWIAEFILYFALLGALFDLDESDTWYCVLVIFLVRLGVYFTLLWWLGRA